MLRTTFLAALITNRPVFWSLVVAMGCARIYLSEHWLSDVAGGFLLGMAMAAVAAAIYAGGPEDGERRRESHRRLRHRF
jgi:membrane-associated phospholipid phosphatase